MKTDRILRLASAAVLCTMLAACGGEPLLLRIPSLLPRRSLRHR